jgi:hypothetical protein
MMVSWPERASLPMMAPLRLVRPPVVARECPVQLECYFQHAQAGVLYLHLYRLVLGGILPVPKAH